MGYKQVGLSKDGKKIIFVRNESFKGSIYESTALADEPEKFAVFNKAVYTLAKAKVAEALGEPLSSSAPIMLISLIKLSGYVWSSELNLSKKLLNPSK